MKIWHLLGGCGSGRKIDVDNSKLAAGTFGSRAQVLPSTKMLTQAARKGRSSRIKILFLHLIDYI
jgi:hypothetical protein